MTVVLGVVGGLLFAFAAVPQAIATIHARKHLGTPISIILSVLAGTICMYSYLTSRNGFDPLLTTIYSIESVSWSVLLFYARRV